MRVGIRDETGRYRWIPVAFHDGVARLDLGRLIPGLDAWRVTLEPHCGTRSFRIALPGSEPTAATPARPEPARDQHRRDGDHPAEARIRAAMQDADRIARAAVRRHVAKAAHPDQVPARDRAAYDTALQQAFSNIDTGRFALPE